MTTDKTNFFSRIFGAKQSCCCNLKIEEVAEEEQHAKEEEKNATENKSSDCSLNPKDENKDRQPPSCCCR